jgi:flagellar protein FlaG
MEPLNTQAPLPSPAVSQGTAQGVGAPARPAFRLPPGADAPRPTAPEKTPNAQDKDPDPKGSLVKALESQLNQPLELSISQDKDTQQWVIRLQDPSSHQVVRQIPTDEMLALAKHLREAGQQSKGLLVNAKA